MNAANRTRGESWIFFKDIGADAKVVNYYQVGYPAAGKTRPLVVCMESPEDRSAILNLAKQLKNQQRTLQRTSTC
jgi:hypothetical protein